MDSQRNEQAPAGAHRLLHPVEGYAPKTECFSPFVEPAKPEDRETQPQQSGATHSRDRQRGQRAGSKELKPVPERHAKVGDEEQTSKRYNGAVTTQKQLGPRRKCNGPPVSKS